MENSQGPRPPKKSLPELVAAILQEDIQLSRAGLELRQPPIGDDYDNWAHLQLNEYSPEKWLYAAESVIRAIDHARQLSQGEGK